MQAKQEFGTILFSLATPQMKHSEFQIAFFLPYFNHIQNFSFEYLPISHTF